MTPRTVQTAVRPKLTVPVARSVTAVNGDLCSALFRHEAVLTHASQAVPLPGRSYPPALPRMVRAEPIDDAGYRAHV